MSAATIIGLALWLALSAASVWVWLPRTRSAGYLLRRPVLVTVLGVEITVTAVVAALLARAGQPSTTDLWLGVGVAVVAAVLCGGAVATCVLFLADASAQPPGPSGRPALRGGTWIGALERIALFGTLLAGWPEGVAVIVAVKAFARYPELKAGQTFGATERFIIGTFTSLTWAAVCTGIAALLR